METHQLVRFSKFMSLVLRHRPHQYGLTLDANGWAKVEDLVAAAKRANVPLTPEIVKQVVAHNDKQRYGLNAEGTAIRARQGHSIKVNLDLTPLTPPEQLFHGTAEKFIPSIAEKGLVRGSRQYVHLSLDMATAHKVGQRHGQAVVLTVASGQMSHDGHPFYCSENKIWLTEAVPTAYLTFPTASSR